MSAEGKKQVTRCRNHASRVINKFKQVQGFDSDAPVHEALTDLLVDLLTDLRHWADMEEIEFYGALDLSYIHYSAEKQEEIKP